MLSSKHFGPVARLKRVGNAIAKLFAIFDSDQFWVVAQKLRHQLVGVIDAGGGGEGGGRHEWLSADPLTFHPHYP